MLDWARQAQLSAASKGQEKDCVETGETLEPGDRDRVDCVTTKAPDRRRESQGLCREDVVCTVDEVRKSCKSQQLSLHVYTEVSVRMMMMKLVEEMITDVMRHTRGVLLSEDDCGDMSEILQMG